MSDNNDMVKLLVGVLVLGLVLFVVVSLLRKDDGTTHGNLDPTAITNPAPNPDGGLANLKEEVVREWDKLVGEHPNITEITSLDEYAELSDQFSPEQIKEHFLNEGFENNEEETVEEVEEQIEANSNLPGECGPKEVLNSADLLPADANSQWAQANPSGQGSLTDKNFLNAGYHVGTNTVGQSLRNANRQLRSDPPNPQVKVSPWMQTTIEPDINRKPMEIGA